MKIRWHGMLGTNHSWAFTQQALARAMVATGRHEVFLKSTNGLKHFPDDLKGTLLPGYHCHPQQPFLPHFMDQYGNVVEVQKQGKGGPPEIPDGNRPYDLDIAYTIFMQGPRRFFPETPCKMLIWNFESSILPPGWHMYHRAVDYFLPSSQYSSDIFTDSGVPKEKSVVVPHGVYRDMFNPDIPPFKLRTQKKVKFLHCAIPHHRKLHDRVLAAYLEAFTGDDDVCLVMKTKLKPPDRDKPFEVNVKTIIENALKGRKNPPEIEVVQTFVPDIGSLYTAVNSVVSMSACEGFCLLPGTLVDVSTSPKPVERVTEGDFVYSHTGRRQKVTGTTFRMVDEDVVEIRRLGDSRLFKATQEHPHMAVKRRGRRFAVVRRAVENGKEVPQWVSLGKLNEGDLVAIPKPAIPDRGPSIMSLFYKDAILCGWSDRIWLPHSYQKRSGPSLKDVAKKAGCSFQHVARVLSHDHNCSLYACDDAFHKTPLAKKIKSVAKRLGYEKPEPLKLPRTIKLNEKLAEFAGLYTAEGSVISGGNAVEFSSHADEKWARAIQKHIGRRVLGAPTAEYIRGKRGSVTISSKIIADTMAQLCGRGARQKRIPDTFFNRRLGGAFLRGLFYGDGTSSKGSYSFSTSSPRLAQDVCQLLAAFNILCHVSLDVRDRENHIITVAKQHNNRFFLLVKPRKYDREIRLPNSHRNNSIVETNECFFVPIRSKRIFRYKGPVYNLHVEEDESFTSGGMATHNCLPLLEALACETLVIAPRHGGQLDFLNDDNSLLVNTGEMKAPKSMQYWHHHPESVVGDPDVIHCAELMRRVYENTETEKSRVAEARERTVSEFTWDRPARMILDLAEETVARKRANPKPARRKVLYIVPYPMAGGAETWIREAIQRLDKERYEASIAFPSGVSAQLRSVFGDLGVPLEDLRAQGHGFALKALIESDKPDIVHFHNSLQVYKLLLTCLKDGAWRGRIVETAHSDLVWNDSMAKIAARRGVSLILSVSSTLAKKLVKQGNRNVAVMPQQVDWNRFRIPRSKDVLEAEDLPNSGFIVGMVARLSPEKNIPLVLECAKMMPDATFIVVGGGAQEKVLRQMASKVPNVRMIGRRTDVEKFYTAFDALLITSKIEGLPLVALEAMAAGTPVVSGAVGAMREILASGKNGFLVADHSRSDGFIEGLRRLRDPSIWQACSDGARALADEMERRGKEADINKYYDMLFSR